MSNGAVVFRHSRLPFTDAVLLIAVLVSGAAAGAVTSHGMWIATPLVALAVWMACRRRTPEVVELESQQESARDQDGGPVSGESVWPPALALQISATMGQLPAGNALRLIGLVLRQARPLFLARESAFDEAYERVTREHVSELVSGACDVAVELAQLDGVTTRGAHNPGAELAERYDRARRELVTRLDDAAQALGELYASGVESGTPASDRVTMLAAELRADAKARAEAIRDMKVLLGNRTQS